MQRSFRLLAIVLLQAGCYCSYGGCGIGSRPTVGESCDPASSGGLCPIATWAPEPPYSGLLCRPGPDDGGFSCQMPGELEPCTMHTGCPSPLTCDLTTVCVATCASSSDCTDPLTSCQILPGGPSCADNGADCQVGPLCWPTACQRLWEPCGAAADGGDGTCVPLTFDAHAMDAGSCLQGGSVPSGGACQYTRGPAPGLCAPGLICLLDSTSDGGICMPLCDPAGGGPRCGPDEVCVPELPPPVDLAIDVGIGGCAARCSPDAGPGCVAPARCVARSPGDPETACLP